MSANFEITINAIRTTTVGEMTNVIKQVEWTLKGSESGRTFELPQKTVLPDPDGQPFIPLAQLTEAEVTAWVESNDTRIEAIKSHIQYVLDKEVSKASLASTPMPWAPVVEPTPAPIPAPVA